MKVVYEGHMGDDLKVVNMARVSFGKRSEWTDMYNQRSDPHAQKEVQMVAEQIKEIIEPLYPISWKELTK